MTFLWKVVENVQDQHVIFQRVPTLFIHRSFIINCDKSIFNVSKKNNAWNNPSIISFVDECSGRLGTHLVSFILYELLQTVHNVQVPISAEVDKIARVQPTILINRFCCCLFVSKVFCTLNQFYNLCQLQILDPSEIRHLRCQQFVLAAYYLKRHNYALCLLQAQDQD